MPEHLILINNFRIGHTEFFPFFRPFPPLCAVPAVLINNVVRDAADAVAPVLGPAGVPRRRVHVHRGKHLRIATWNVQSLVQLASAMQVARELDTNGIDIAALQEVRRPGEVRGA